ncbi:MAG: polysaccharide pyruvyl transferase family protein [Muribaculaceae bacterium]|nr:polysaccharide pyruvyl transferase family protein [Muribaculaceae bacterium]
MKKVSFITVHVGSNFGSVLQAIATSHLLKSIGYSAELINYIPERVSFRYYMKGALYNVKRFVWRLFNLPIFFINRKIYEDFLKKNCKVSSPIYSKDDFSSKCPKADVYLTGSDQVWNSKHNQGIDIHYYFGGVEGTKIAYASSFGTIMLLDEEHEQVKSLLNDYKAISVREKSALNILKTMGYEAIQVLDPTFMLDKNKWKSFMSKRLVKEPYILMYLPYNIVDKSIIYKTARKIGHKYNLKVITFSWNYFIDIYADRTMRFCNPGDFLSLMYYAEYIITNSFHGTAFSINLNKQFWVYMPSIFGTRIKSIVDLCGLNNRMLENEIDDSLIEEKIDYEPVNLILERERQIAIDYLKKTIG